MDSESLAQRLRAAFLQELGDHVEALNRNLLSLEKAEYDDTSKREELVNSLFRSAHTLKGAARSAGIRLIEKVGHHLESILMRYRDTGDRPGECVFRVLFPAIDAIEEAGEIMKANGELDSGRIRELLPELERAATEEPAEAEPAEPPTKEAPKGVPPELEVPIERLIPPKPEPKVTSIPAAVLTRNKKKAASRNSKKEKSPEANSMVSSPKASESVRVPAAKLDTMLTGSGQLLSACEELNACSEGLRDLKSFIQSWKHDTNSQDRLLELEGKVRDLSRSFMENRARLHRAALDLDEEIHRFRLFPFADGCGQLERAVRDLAQASQKEVNLKITGGDTELDRTVLECLKGPLLHLVRNAVDHGIELPGDREAAGKPASATIHVRAQLLGDRIEVTVEDDGQGIDEDKVRSSKSKAGHIDTSALDLLELLAIPGFSTAEMITEVSGRGVGLDAAKSGIESIGGRMELETTVGCGTRFTMIAPLTITTLRVVLVNSADQTFAIPTHAVERMARLERSAIHTVEGREVVSIDGKPVLLYSLHGLLGFDASEDSEQSDKISLIILSMGSERVGLAVDEFLDSRQVVAKKMGRRVGQLPLTSGATLLPGGKIALILNTAGVVRQTRLGGKTQSLRGNTVEDTGDDTKLKRIIYAEDSPTTRSLVSHILTSHGYEVTSTVDGEAGWETLQESGADIIVSDVDMPRMNGFQFTERVRRSRRFKDVPVILVTSRETEKDKQRGMEVGANAYIVKGEFDQTCLLETLNLMAA